MGAVDVTPKIHTVRHSARCKTCLQEVRTIQVDYRNNARIPCMFRCPKHGTLYIQDVVFGQTEDKELMSPIVGPWTRKRR